MFRNNKHRDTAQRFTIKKFKFGAASVLIGTVFAVFAGGAQAETETSVTESTASTTLVSETEVSSTEVSTVETLVVAEEVVSEPVASSEETVASSEVATSSEEVSEESKSETSTSSSEETAKETKAEAMTTATSTSASVTTPSRVVATTYKVTYTDVETGAVIANGRSKSTVTTTSLPVEETDKVTFEVTEKANMSLPELTGYKLVAGQAEVQAAIITYGDRNSRFINFNVVKEDVAAAGGNNDNETDLAGFRAASDTVDAAIDGGSSYTTLDRVNATMPFTVVIKSYQGTSENTVPDTPDVPGRGGRLDAPLSAEETQKLSSEALLWTGKVRPTGQTITTPVYGSTGGYEFIATEIYRNVYEQGVDYVYIQNVKSQYDLSEESKAQGYRLRAVELDNLPPGLGYNPNTDTIEGYIISRLQNGVYERRVTLLVEDANGRVIRANIHGLHSGWIGWTDSDSPTIAATSVAYTIDDTISHNIQYSDNDAVGKDTQANYKWAGGVLTGPTATRTSETSSASFTTKNGTVVKANRSPQITAANTGVAGISGSNANTINSLVPGTTYNPTTGNISGTLTTSGIYTLSAYGKDYGANARDRQWTQYGQETNEFFTIAVKPKVEVQNVEVYATEVPVKISAGTNQAKLTMPDGTVTNLVLQDGRWIVSADDTTNTAVSAGQDLGAEGIAFTVPVTSNSTQYAGVDTIALETVTENVTAILSRKSITLQDAANVSRTAILNKETGKYELPIDEAFTFVDNGDNTSTITERRIYNEDNTNGQNNYIVYEFTRTYNTTSSASTLIDKINEVKTNGRVTAVGNVTRTVTTLPSTTQVNYDANTKTWTAADGSTVTAVEDGEGWTVETDSGFSGHVAVRKLVATDVASIENEKPVSDSTSYNRPINSSVDLLNESDAAVSFRDAEDDQSSDEQSETIVTGFSVTNPDGSVKSFDSAKDEETKFIQATKDAAAAQAAVAAEIQNLTSSQMELAVAEEAVIRAQRHLADAQKAVEISKLQDSSASRTPKAEAALAETQAKLAAAQAMLAEKQAALTTSQDNLTVLKRAELVANQKVETAREALKTASEVLKAEVEVYTLSQTGEYAVTVTAVDSNGIVTNPTVGGTDSGEVVDDAVTSTTYYITVQDIKARPEYTSGVLNETQTDNMADNFTVTDTNASVVYRFVDPSNNSEVTSLTTVEGIYTINENTGAVTFIPVTDFVGTATAVSVKATATSVDRNNQSFSYSATTTYTPTVYGISATNVTSSDYVDVNQTGQPSFTVLNNADNTTNYNDTAQNESIVTIPATGAYRLENADAEGKVVVDGQGTYTINADTGVVTFDPVPSFTGTATTVSVTVRGTATDKEGSTVTVEATGTYTPTVINLTPTAKDRTSEDYINVSQTTNATSMFKAGTDGNGTEALDETSLTLLDANGNPTTSITVAEGTYVLENGTITFTPNTNYTGDVTPVTVRMADLSGDTATATYTPRVINLTPTAKDRTSEDYINVSQTTNATSMFKAGTDGNGTEALDETSLTLLDAESNPATTVTVAEGTYVLENGTITFTPNTNYTGDVIPVTVRMADLSGDTATATYTPRVINLMPTAKDRTSEDYINVAQTTDATSMFKAGTDGNGTEALDETSLTLLDANGNPATSVTVAEGTYV
ncbi:YSIRK-type signal peptide-containing protein, partial [Streptococcus sp. sy004]|uniref:YSIRK-type signal peptide-containing protein n=1 Tax=Streptococcus sp. sy004 TaxID=2600149 RepID=UPI001C945A74